MRFEWDRVEAQLNHRKHGITFGEALTVFDDLLSATLDDPDHSTGEQRFVTVGHSSRGRLLVVSHTESGETIRIISARLATAAERNRHET